MFTVGVDDLLQRALGPVDEIELPDVGDHVEAGEPLFSLRHGSRTLDVGSPVAGTVLETNPELLDSPTTINRSPYADGWAARLAADDVKASLRSLRSGRESRRWFRGEVDRLVGQVSAGRAGAMTLSDGGAVVPSLHDEIDAETWDRLAFSMFGRRG